MCKYAKLTRHISLSSSDAAKIGHSPHSEDFLDYGWPWWWMKTPSPTHKKDQVNTGHSSITMPSINLEYTSAYQWLGPCGSQFHRCLFLGGWMKRTLRIGVLCFEQVLVFFIKLTCSEIDGSDRLADYITYLHKHAELTLYASPATCTQSIHIQDGPTDAPPPTRSPNII